MEGGKLEKITKKREIPQTKLAKMMKVTPQTITKMFKTKSIGSDKLEEFCRALGLKINDLYEGTDLYQEVLPTTTATIEYNDPEKEIIKLKAENNLLRELFNLKQKEKVAVG